MDGAPDSLGIVEVATHENDLHDLCTIASGAFDVTVFTSAEVRERVTEGLDADVEWVIRGESESLASFLGTVEDRSSDLDALYLMPLSGPLPDFVRYARFRPDCPTVLTVFNTSAWFAPNLRFTPKLYNYLRPPLRRLVLRNVDAVAVEYDTIAEYAAPRAPLPVRVMTPVVYDGATRHERDDDRVQVTVPGMIDPERRDYATVVDALDALPGEYADRLRLTLLGRPVGDRGETVVASFDRLREAGWTVDHYDEWIPAEAFRAGLRDSDLLLAPLQPTKDYGVSVEEYGRTKTSGALHDSIRYGQPLLLPSGYEPPGPLRESIRNYRGSAGLADELERLLDGEAELSALQAAATEASRHYTVDRQRDRLVGLVDELSAL